MQTLLLLLTMIASTILLGLGLFMLGRKWPYGITSFYWPNLLTLVGMSMLAFNYNRDFNMLYGYTVVVLMGANLWSTYFHLIENKSTID